MKKLTFEQLTPWIIIGLLVGFWLMVIFIDPLKP